ncbi:MULTISPECIES: AAC(3) family N-acetyltransferase [unclassified Photobacterium]|uniref:AAC(3) family N-acetyltransferase n=1 Tax=unclassified Photobacterium TaxID=2628852 RepID=UPI001EDCCCDB|nr:MULTISPECIES: AAC(3) family N-acetyltransferase [unclassified Photobacterium]MCG3864918.1 AAC(3) family N-acetyltransferase [Photobacterium sp. Ph6]MCG3876326.1 AAC(3) family N-acetyltransferase [Photobacterium sp. Ph5]
MANDTLIRKIFAISPYIEVLGRKIYWNNVKHLSTVTKKSIKNSINENPVNFNEIKNFLYRSGVSDGSLILVHSAFSPLKSTGLSPTEIINELCSLIGDTGTIAMPAMPKFKQKEEKKEYLIKNNTDYIYEYDVKKSPIKTGLLPAYLHRNKNSIRSRHPINTMVAMGPLATTLMNDNLSGLSPLPCGYESSWSKCIDHDAIIISLGTDLTHSLTAIHVAEDRLDKDWPISNWYREKRFIIKDGEFQQDITLRERQPKWGALHFAERTLCKDLINSGIMHSTKIDGVTVEVVKGKDLIEFLNKNNNSGYPYFGTSL